MRVAAFVLIMSMQISAQVLDPKTYSTTGKPTEAMATPDGQYVLVTVDTGGSSGIDVFHLEGDKLKRTAFQALGNDGAQGILLLPGTRTLAVGLSNQGVAFLPLDEALTGKAKVNVLPQGDRSGTGYLAATPDGQFLFAANEYGDGGNTSVIALHKDAQGQLHPETIGHIPTTRTTPGVTLSPDGTRLFAVGEVEPPNVGDRLPGSDNKVLRHDGCVQGQPGRGMPTGALFEMDVTKMSMWKPGVDAPEIRAARAGWTNAGCSPVREAVNADGSLVYVTARGDNKVLVFDIKKLETDPNHAFVRSIDSGGDAPVGLKLFDDGKKLLVANSNRFRGGPGNASVFDVSAEKPVLLQTIKTGEFPRNITASPDGATLYLTIFNGNELMVLRRKK